MKRLKKSVSDLPRYVVEQEGAIVKLNQNESPIDIPDTIKREILERLRRLSWNRYPKLCPRSLRDRIADYTGFPPAGILVGNGSNELIQSLISATCASDDTILVVEPGFSIYERLARTMDVNVQKVPLNDDLSLNPRSIADGARSAKLVILASPNNPTGSALPVDAVGEIAKETAGTLAVDEAYYEFHGESAQKHLDTMDNVVVLRTFSKAFSLAGIRLGYLLARESVAEHLEKAKLPFSAGIFQQVAGEVILDNIEFVRRSVETIVRERERVFAGLERLQGVSPYPSRTNFILFEVEGREARDLYKRLCARGVLIRHFDGPRLERALRVTVGTREENDVFLDGVRRELDPEAPRDRRVGRLTQSAPCGRSSPTARQGPRRRKQGNGGPEAARTGDFERATKETTVSASVTIDGRGESHIETPLGFFNHMLESFAKHGMFDLNLRAEGDLHVDQHHLVEDCGLALGAAFLAALGDKRGINRAGYFVYPMDEALAVIAVDIGGRPFLQYDATFARRFCGEFDTDLLEDFLRGFATQLRANVIARIPFGRSDHHKIEAIFKAFGKAMRTACSVDSRDMDGIPSTKGLIEDDRDS